MATATATETKQTAAYVVFDGPEPTQNRDGDEIPVWSVTICAADDSELKAYSIYSYDRGIALARRIATDRRIELVNDGDRA